MREFGNVLQGLDQESSVIHLEALIECVGRYIWSP
jgi:hypothetical protein